jgi:hypothetical protein
MEHDQVIRKNIRAPGIELVEHVVEIHMTFAQRRTKNGRIAVRMKRVATGVIEWETQAKRLPGTILR